MPGSSLASTQLFVPRRAHEGPPSCYGLLEGWIDVAITRDQVLHVARLARLDLSEAEVEQLTGELGAILDAVSKVSELDLADVPPTSHPLDLVNSWAEDEPHDSLPLEDVLRNAPASERDMFRVPPTA